MSRKINKFIENLDLKFGDYILFQEYIQAEHDGMQYHYKVSKPIYAIYLGYFILDMAACFNYVQWINQNLYEYTLSESGTKYYNNKEVGTIKSHIEWSNYIDILGRWSNKPNWKELLTAYRLYDKRDIIKSEEIEWKLD